MMHKKIGLYVGVMLFLFAFIGSSFASDELFFLRDGKIYSLSSQVETEVFSIEGVVEDYRITPDVKQVAFKARISTGSHVLEDGTTQYFYVSKLMLGNLENKKYIDITPQHEGMLHINSLLSDHRLYIEEIIGKKTEHLIIDFQDASKAETVFFIPTVYAEDGLRYYALMRSFKIIGRLREGKTIDTSLPDYLYMKKMHDIVYEDTSNLDTELYPASISPDGKFLSFYRRYKLEVKQGRKIVKGTRCELWLLNLSTKKAHRKYTVFDKSNRPFYFREHRVVWAKDGSHIAFSSIYPYFIIYNLATNESAMIEGTNYVFSNDSKKVYYEKDKNIRMIGTDGRGSKVIVERGNSPMLVDKRIEKS